MINVTIKAAPRANPLAEDSKPWNIFQDGRCTNVGPTKDAALRAVQKLVSRGALYEGELSIREEVKAAYTGVPRPRGCPDIGATVIAHGHMKGEVTSYLSSQFVITNAKGEWIVSPSEEWKVI